MAKRALPPTNINFSVSGEPVARYSSLGAPISTRQEAGADVQPTRPSITTGKMKNSSMQRDKRDGPPRPSPRTEAIAARQTDSKYGRIQRWQPPPRRKSL